MPVWGPTLAWQLGMLASAGKLCGRRCWGWRRWQEGTLMVEKGCFEAGIPWRKNGLAEEPSHFLKDRNGGGKNSQIAAYV